MSSRVKSSFNYISDPNLKEKIASDYLFFRSPYNYLLLILPFWIGIFLINLLRIPQSDLLAFNDLTALSMMETEIINQYLFGVRFSILSLYAILMIYRWNIIKKSGSYGYWIAMGVTRYRLLIYTLFKFVSLLLVGIITGFVFMAISNGIYLDISLLFKIIFYTIGSLILLTGIGTLLSELIQNPNIAIILFIMISSISFLDLENNALLAIFFSTELGSISILSVAVSAIFGLVLIIFSLNLHNKAEFNLR